MSGFPEPIVLESRLGSIQAYAYGAQVVQWVPRGDSRSVLWLSPVAALCPGVAIRGGIPVCFPWFGPGLSGVMTPSHGFARTATWDLVESGVSGDQLAIRMRLTSAMASDAQFPHKYSAEISIQAGHDLKVELAVRNHGEQAFAFEEALHAYLAVADVEGVVIDGLDGAEYSDKTREGERSVQSGSLRIIGEVDRAYRSTSDVVVHDRDRTLRISKSGSASTVVWNPGKQLASRMADIGADAWRGFVCVEAGNVLDDVVTLAPGCTHRLSYRLNVTT